MPDANELIELTADIVSAHVSYNSVAVGDVANLVQRVHAALVGLSQAAPAEEAPKVGATSARASIKPDYLVCMACGKKQKTLKRHIQTAHGLTPAQYRSEYGLVETYPMTSANYSKRRSDMARAIGLGRKRGDRVGKDAAKPARKPRAPKKAAPEG